MTVGPRRFVNVEQARAKFGPAVDRLGVLLMRGDPLADRAVEALSALPKARAMAMVDQAITRGIATTVDAPRALVDLFEEVETVPAWLDKEALARGGQLLFRVGWFGGLALAASLLFGYASPAGNKPLVFSGRLVEQTPRRLAETSRFVEQTCIANGLAIHAEGYAITVRVRIMHAYVRRMLRASPGWKEEEWGVPANQHDMGATSLLFSIVVIDSLRNFGFLLSDEEVHLYMQLWRYSGYLIGVDSEVLPTSEHDARRLLDMIGLTEEGPDDDSRRLSRALFASGETPARATQAERERAEKMVQLGQGLIRGVLGEELSDQLDVPRHAYRHAFGPVKALVRAAELAANRAPAPLSERYRTRGIASGRTYWDTVVRSTGEPISFPPPDALLGKIANVAEASSRNRSTLGSYARPR